MHQSPLEALHPWLLSATNIGVPYVVVDTGATPIKDCTEKIAGLLNEFDDAGDAQWIHLEPALIKAVASSKEHRRLLSIEDEAGSCDPTSTCGIRRVLRGFARRGRFVVNHPEATRALAGDPMGFRAAIGRPVAAIEDFHLILNPTCFRPRCLASLIADSYLEWAAAACVG